ncbi:branched-chain amino acid ABC transporter permease [Streptomyces sp. KR80]|uniref:branched-chain amino acid ABC transporter permease n=1 Tax=Streptomyces sp. KR80 TaxID=3457426 RepID=UPI003FD54323
MSRFVFLTSEGLIRGSVYAAFALALVLIWRGTRVVNFAQGAMAVACAYVAYSVVTRSGSYWTGFIAALATGLLMGALVERLVIRPVEEGPHLNAVIVSLGLAMAVQGLMGIVYGNETRMLPTPFSQNAFAVGDVALGSPFDLFVLGVVLALMAGLALLFSTSIGLRMRASAFAPEVSRLLGVNVSRMRTLGWALAAMVGALAAMLAVPTGPGLHPSAMDLVFVSAFTGAAAGGLDSPPGAVLGGLSLGLVLSYVTGFLDSGLASPTVLVLLVAVLLARPAGVFSPRRARRV